MPQEGFKKESACSEPLIGLGSGSLWCLAIACCNSCVAKVSCQASLLNTQGMSCKSRTVQITLAIYLLDRLVGSGFDLLVTSGQSG